MTSLNVLSYQKRITSAPLSGSKKVVPLQKSLLLTSYGSSEFINVSTITSHGLTTFPEPHIADALYQNFYLTWHDFIASLSPHLSQNIRYQLWTPSPQILSAMPSALLRKHSKQELLLVMPPKSSLPVISGPSSQLSWASTPFSRPSKTNYQCYESLPSEFVSENLLPTAIPSGLSRLKLTYRTLRRRSSTWGPKIHSYMLLVKLT
ncbi:hypothetical protein ACHAW6_007160 [Cyclotella cf. meneghiniana]